MKQENPYQTPSDSESEPIAYPVGRVFALVSIGFIVLIPIVGTAANILFAEKIDSFNSHAGRAIVCFAVAYVIWQGSNFFRIVTAMLLLLFAGMMAYLVMRNGIQLSSRFLTFAIMMVGTLVTGVLRMLPPTNHYLTSRRR